MVRLEDLNDSLLLEFRSIQDSDGALLCASNERPVRIQDACVSQVAIITHLGIGELVADVQFAPWFSLLDAVTAEYALTGENNIQPVLESDVVDDLVLEGHRSHVLALDGHVVVNSDNTLFGTIANHDDKAHVVTKLLELDGLDKALKVDLGCFLFVSFSFLLHFDRWNRILGARLLRDPDCAIVIKFELGLL